MESHLGCDISYGHIILHAEGDGERPVMLLRETRSGSRCPDHT